ncbi:MAG TPA: hypothetical protein PKX93_09105 [bacterium]|nr:hypothetical protein [bacterium]
MEEQTRKRLVRTRGERKVRRWQRLKLLAGSLSLILIVSSCFIVRKFWENYLRSLPFFTLEQISVTPPEYLGEVERIIQAEPTRNLLWMDLERLYRALMALPGAGEVKIQKRLPHGLDVFVSLRHAWIRILPEDVVIDRNGWQLPDRENSVSLLAVKGIGLENGRVRPADYSKIALLREVERWYNAYNLKVFFHWQEVDLTDINRIVLKSQEGEVYLCADQPRVKMYQLKQVLQGCARKQIKWQYVDMRFRDPYLKPLHE